MAGPREKKILIKDLKITDDPFVVSPFLANLIGDLKDSDRIIPKNIPQILSVRFEDAYVGFANTIRRVLVEELPVTCLHFEHTDFETTDPYILEDTMLKSISLIPIMQDVDVKQMSLRVENTTNKRMFVTSGHISTGGSTIIPIHTIPIAILDPGKSLVIKKLTIKQGYGYADSGKFSLLEVKYDVDEPPSSDEKKNTVLKDLEVLTYNPTGFNLSFRTAGNISAKRVVEKLYEEMTGRLNAMKKNILEYSNTAGDITNDTRLEIKKNGDHYIYRFVGEYLTLCQMIAQKCYLMDPNIAYVTAGVERYDSMVGLVKINHPNRTEILVKAIDACIGEITMFRDEVKKIKK